MDLINLNGFVDGIRRSQPLLTVEEVPISYREPAIVTGYRPLCCTPLQCVASVFIATNETLNFWTHFIPTFYFTWKLIQLSQTLDFLEDHYTWGLLSYMLTCCIYPFISCTAHAFSSMSNSARHICYFLDYGALSVHSCGVAVMYRCYSFPTELYMNGSYRDIFLYGSIVCAIICTLSSCVSRFAASRLRVKLLRLGAFVLPYVWMTIPLVYRVLHCDRSSASVPHHERQLVVAMLAGFFYAVHIPERLAPGKFDIVGHSHQLMHIFGIMATFEQMNGAILDMQERRQVIIENGWMLSWHWSLGAVAFVFICNALLICLFSVKVLRESSGARNETKKKAS